MGAKIIEYDVPFDSHKLYGVVLGKDEIETLVTRDSCMVEVWITTTLSENQCRLGRLIVGLDTEWSPDPLSHRHTVATLQLCVGKRCLIYQIIHATATQIPQSLRAFLANPDFTFVGVGIKGDVEKLIRSDCSLMVGNSKDLCPWAAEELGREELRGNGVGLKRLVKEVVGEEMDKQHIVTCSRWDIHPLTLQQVTYACLDAYFSFEIGRRLSAWYN